MVSFFTVHSTGIHSTRLYLLSLIVTGRLYLVCGEMKFPHDDSIVRLSFSEEGLVILNELIVVNSGIMIPTIPDNTTQYTKHSISDHYKN